MMIGEERIQVILVDERDNVVGLAGKMDAHRRGLLHRAFSIFIRNTRGEILLQQRALHKYHSGGLWTNACCSHPRPDWDGPATEEAATRLQEEMGFTTPLTHLDTFRYHAAFSNGLQEHELDHVYAGTWDGPVQPDPEEAAAWRWISAKDLDAELLREPGNFTAWFAPAWNIFKSTFGRPGSNA